MDNAALRDTRVKQSLVVLANGSELVANIVRKIVGNDISDTLNGSRVTANTLRTLAQARFKRILVKNK